MTARTTGAANGSLPDLAPSSEGKYSGGSQHRCDGAGPRSATVTRKPPMMQRHPVTRDLVLTGESHGRARFDRTNDWRGHWLSP